MQVKDERVLKIVGKNYKPFGNETESRFKDLFLKDREIIWPSEDGFDGPGINTTIINGTFVDRIGDESGGFLASDQMESHIASVNALCGHGQSMMTTMSIGS